MAAAQPDAEHLGRGDAHDFSLSDASLWRSDSISALRDAIFLSNRWLPPGLRLIGLPIAALSDAAAAPTALRISATVLTVLTLAVIYIGLRPIAGYGGAAAGALLFALSPLNLVGAQAFMTELVLHLCFALALALLAWEVVAKRPSTLRLILLGPVLGLGALAKLTFLPTIGLAWLGCVAYRWFIERDAKELRLRLAVPAVGLALVAWPHYLLNGARYVSYAKATALGYAYSPAEERGIAFLLRAFGSFSWDMLGIGGVLLLLVAAVLAVLHWRRLTGPERAIMALAALAAAPPVMAYLLSRNQTERYLGLSVVALAFPVGIAIGASLRDGLGAARVRALIAAPAAAAFVQIGLCWFIAVRGPVETRAFRPIDDAAWRQNEMCDFRRVTEILPRGMKPLRVGVFGLTIGVHAFVVEQAFLLDTGPSKVIELVDSDRDHRLAAPHAAKFRISTYFWCRRSCGRALATLRAMASTKPSARCGHAWPRHPSSTTLDRCPVGRTQPARSMRLPSARMTIPIRPGIRCVPRSACRPVWATDDPARIAHPFRR